MRRERCCCLERSHLGESERRLRPSGSVVSAVNWPEVGSGVRESLFEDVVSGGGVSLGGSVVVSSSVESSVESSVGSPVVPSFVSVDVELSGGVKPLVSIVLDDGDKSGVSVEFESVVKSVMFMQLFEVTLERSLLFIRVGSCLAGIIQEVVVVVLTPDMSYVGFVRLVVYVPEVSFEIVAGSIMVVAL